jgi:hypothetical protein
MKAMLLVPYYLHWHYGEALQSIVRIIRNFIWFTGHLFSIGLLLKTLFTPWQRIMDYGEKNQTMSDVVGTYVVNILMRFAGGIIRLVVISMGLVTSILIAIGGGIFFLLWIAFPLLLFVFVIFGIVFLVQ